VGGDRDAGGFSGRGFAMSSVTGDTISGSIGATMEDVTAPEKSAGLVSAGGSFTVPAPTVMCSVPGGQCMISHAGRDRVARCSWWARALAAAPVTTITVSSMAAS
jgi:hypothetical protein